MVSKVGHYIIYTLVLRHITTVHKDDISKNNLKNVNLGGEEDCENHACRKFYGRSHIQLWCKQCTLFQSFPKIKSSKKKRKQLRPKKNKDPKKICPECGKNVQHLEQHLKIVHVKDEQICSECGKECKNTYFLDAHIKNVHEKIPCTECGRLIGVGKITTHLKTHEKRFKCDVCGKGFGAKENLKDHNNVHTGEKPYVCKFCSNRFASFGTLRMHERSHEGNGRKYSKK